ncbi:threonine aldolase [Sporanaerobium hydrogeniformans]|uniref:Threonine aldolase n=1 Tax=Sporanaerobium hydrogeniformans TaxID=3072179 RepID=A0AC61D9T7_9FIRM|nr:low specificity L-threonine aldolase [Sporanaerobium hydrogeniformans]PHV70066.1 threonine aldolase [Sporanaerobium hydrogeniformans]
MYSFKNDYSEGAHPNLLEGLMKYNLEQVEGYGLDSWSEKAREAIKGKLENEEVDIHFLVGGTQTNLLAISAFLRPHEAVIATTSGHIFVHETGAIEATGHKVITVKGKKGKLSTEDIEEVLIYHTDEHMVKPKFVYISQSTEIGTIYTKAELEALSEYCKKQNLLFYMDGARLGSALTAEGNDVSLKDLARLLDAFYIGGTKNGALMGEALVICNPSLKEDFRYHIKQKGALLAKGSVLGIQFLELFKEDLFFELADHANRMAALLRQAIKEEGYSFFTDSPTNQIFPIFPNLLIEKLQATYDFYKWEKWDEGHSAVRLVTSWATPEEKVRDFIKDLKEWKK